MASGRIATAVLCLLHSTSRTCADESSSKAAWHQFGTNINYKITAVIDVNGGAAPTPSFDSFTEDDGSIDLGAGGSVWDYVPRPHLSWYWGRGRKTEAVAETTPVPVGYSIPIEVSTLEDEATGEYKQRISYFNGLQVEYNLNGVGFKVVNTPYGMDESFGTSERVCLQTSENNGKKVPFLNFFPTEQQMQHYKIGKLVTDQPGIPYRIATLEAIHGSYNATAKEVQPSLKPGMPTMDWFQFHFQESLSPSGVDGGGKTVHPLKWTMLARNQIINAHTENWVVRYENYEPFSTEDEMTLSGSWFDLNFKKDCGDGKQVTIEQMFGGRNEGATSIHHNQLGMFFSTSNRLNFHPEYELSEFDSFLLRHNKHYGPDEYLERMVIHENTLSWIAKLNNEHAGQTKFVANEYIDMDVTEVMKFRGGHKSITAADETNPGQSASNVSVSSSEPYVVPNGFDPKSLPTSFDWREHLPGSIGQIKDQGVCGSCWAFALVGAVESHWFIHHGQSVTLAEQFVNDCAWSTNVHACDGGDAGTAAETLIERFNGKVPTRDAYGGYLSVDGECYVDIISSIGMVDDKEGLLQSSAKESSTVQITDWMEIPSREEVAIKHALFTEGPLTIALNVVDEALYYSSGVLDVESCTANGIKDLDHAVVLIGWGTDKDKDGNDKEHWLIRNSWSTLWGDSGYWKIRMGDRDCGVTTNAGFPIVAADGQGYALA